MVTKKYTVPAGINAEGKHFYPHWGEVNFKTMDDAHADNLYNSGFPGLIKVKAKAEQAPKAETKKAEPAAKKPEEKK